MSDKITTIKEYHDTAWQTVNPLEIGKLYQSLTTEEGRELAAYAVELLDRQDDRHKDRAEEVLLNLACLTPGALDGFYQELVKRRTLYPGIIYREAGPEISKQLLDLIPATQLQADHLLTALAWIGDANVQQAFHQWRKIPPDWTSSMHSCAMTAATPAPVTSKLGLGGQTVSFQNSGAERRANWQFALRPPGY